VCAAVFFGTACQFGAVHRIEAECCRGVLRQRIGRLSEDTMGYALQRQDPGRVLDLGCEIAERLTNRPADYRDASAPQQLELWHLPEVDWPVADRLVGVVKTVRVQNGHRVVIQKKDGAAVKTKQPAAVLSTNFYATNVDLGSIPPLFIHLKRPSVHQSCALVVLTMIRVLAYTLSMVFYHRQVRSHCRAAPAPQLPCRQPVLSCVDTGLRNR
jgi:hypothetical protein